MVIYASECEHNRPWGWVYCCCSIRAEFGTLLFEFVYLSKITRNPIYAKEGFSWSVKFK